MKLKDFDYSRDGYTLARLFLEEAGYWDRFSDLSGYEIVAAARELYIVKYMQRLCYWDAESYIVAREYLRLMGLWEGCKDLSRYKQLAIARQDFKRRAAN